MIIIVSVAVAVTAGPMSGVPVTVTVFVNGPGKSVFDTTCVAVATIEALGNKVVTGREMVPNLSSLAVRELRTTLPLLVIW